MANKILAKITKIDKRSEFMKKAGFGIEEVVYQEEYVITTNTEITKKLLRKYEKHLIKLPEIHSVKCTSVVE